MIVVDTTVWADRFNGTQTPAVVRLARALNDQHAGLDTDGHAAAARLFRRLRRRATRRFACPGCREPL